MNLPSTVVSQPSGAGDDGSMPSGTAWDEDEAAKKSGARKLEERIVRSDVKARSKEIDGS